VSSHGGEKTRWAVGSRPKLMGVLLAPIGHAFGSVWAVSCDFIGPVDFDRIGGGAGDTPTSRYDWQFDLDVEILPWLDRKRVSGSRQLIAPWYGLSSIHLLLFFWAIYIYCYSYGTWSRRDNFKSMPLHYNPCYDTRHKRRRLQTQPTFSSILPFSLTFHSPSSDPLSCSSSASAHYGASVSKSHRRHVLKVQAHKRESVLAQLVWKSEQSIHHHTVSYELRPPLSRNSYVVITSMFIQDKNNSRYYITNICVCVQKFLCSY
jgi:hypothetical protein